MLVTGGAGFIGSNFVHYWMQHHASDTVVVFDALTYAGCRASLAPLESSKQFRFIEGDICDSQLVAEVLAAEAIDTIVHFAAESHVDRSIVGPDPFIRANVQGTHVLLMAAIRHFPTLGPTADRVRFHHVSTDEVYGSLDEGTPAVSEAAAYAPNSPYAATKAASDHLVRAYHRTYGVPATISNCSNNYGPYQFPEKLIPSMLLKMLGGKSLPIYGNGRNIRDWLFVTDHCRGIEAVIERGKCGRTYNLGARCEVRNVELVRLLCDLVDDTFKRRPELRDIYPSAPCAQGNRCCDLISFVADRPGHDHRYALDTRRAEVELGFTASTPLGDGLHRTADWYLANKRWWRPLLSRLS